jgi:hypothetical protein
MGYCRFENTLNDLKDCKEHLDDSEKDMSKKEVNCKYQLIDICREIATRYNE